MDDLELSSKTGAGMLALLDYLCVRREARHARSADALEQRAGRQAGGEGTP